MDNLEFIRLDAKFATASRFSAHSGTWEEMKTSTGLAEIEYCTFGEVFVGDSNFDTQGTPNLSLSKWHFMSSLTQNPKSNTESEV
jgi:hypothetical protein